TEAESFTFDATTTTVTLRANIAAKPWNTLVNYYGGSMSETPYGMEILFRSPLQTNGSPHTISGTISLRKPPTPPPVTHSTGHQRAANIATMTSSQNGTMAEYVLPGRVKNFKSCVLQTRPFDQWVEIRNVPLNSGKATNLEIKTSDNPK